MNRPVVPVQVSLILSGSPGGSWVGDMDIKGHMDGPF